MYFKNFRINTFDMNKFIELNDDNMGFQLHFYNSFFKIHNSQ